VQAAFGGRLLPRHEATAHWDAVLLTNLDGVFFCCRAASENMIRSRSGRIVTSAPTLGLHGQGGCPIYSASKGGINAFTKSIAQELARRKITANVSRRAHAHRGMTAPMRGEPAAAEGRIPLGRAALPEEIAGRALSPSDARRVHRRWVTAVRTGA
jgi:3-oxoacyl-[acyl-carrier protein] reductase